MNLVFLPATPDSPSLHDTAVRFGATFAAAIASWFLIERPFLSLKQKWS